MNRRIVNLYVEIRYVKAVWLPYVIEAVNAQCIFGVDLMKDRDISRYFAKILIVNQDENTRKVETL